MIQDKKYRRKVLSILATFVAMSTTTSSASQPTVYGTRVNFKKGSPLRFPDFVIEYIGPRLVTVPQYPRGFQHHDFRVTAGEQTLVVSWSYGTGDLGPAPFTVEGKTFWLELVNSQALGWLRDDELVISLNSQPR
jgi:hypothetical protein